MRNKNWEKPINYVIRVAMTSKHYLSGQKTPCGSRNRHVKMECFEFRGGVWRRYLRRYVRHTPCWPSQTPFRWFRHSPHGCASTNQRAPFPRSFFQTFTFFFVDKKIGRPHNYEITPLWAFWINSLSIKIVNKNHAQTPFGGKGTLKRMLSVIGQFRPRYHPNKTKHKAHHCLGSWLVIIEFA